MSAEVAAKVPTVFSRLLEAGELRHGVPEEVSLRNGTGKSMHGFVSRLDAALETCQSFLI